MFRLKHFWNLCSFNTQNDSHSVALILTIEVQQLPTVTLKPAKTKTERCLFCYWSKMCKKKNEKNLCMILIALPLHVFVQLHMSFITHLPVFFLHGNSPNRLPALKWNFFAGRKDCFHCNLRIFNNFFFLFFSFHAQAHANFYSNNNNNNKIIKHMCYSMI